MTPEEKKDFEGKPRRIGPGDWIYETADGHFVPCVLSDELEEEWQEDHKTIPQHLRDIKGLLKDIHTELQGDRYGES